MIVSNESINFIIAEISKLQVLWLLLYFGFASLWLISAEHQHNRRFWGAKVEFGRVYGLNLIPMILGSRWETRKVGLVVNGRFPAEGAGIIVVNHNLKLDGPALFRAAAEQRDDQDYPIGRIIRPVVKLPLLHPGMKEDEEVLDRTGKAGEELNTGQITVKSIFQMMALRGVGAIGIDRSGTKLETVRTINEVLASGQLLGISLTETRNPIGDLRAAQPGAASIIRQNKEVQVWPVGLFLNSSQRKFYVNIDEHPFTYHQLFEMLRQEHAKKSALKHEEITLFLAERLAKLLPSKMIPEWAKSPTLLSTSKD